MFYYYLTTLTLSAYLKQKKYNFIPTLFLATIFFLFFTRNNISADWESYKLIFNGVKSISLEPVWKILISYNPLQQNTFQLFIFTQSLLYISPIPFLVKKYKGSFSVEYFLIYSLVLGFILLGHGYLRQSVASSMLLLAFVFFKEQKYVLYVLFVIVSTLFHLSGAIGLILLLYPLVKRLSLKNTILISVLIPTGLFIPYILNVPMKYSDRVSTGLILRGVLYLYLSLSIYKLSSSYKEKRISIGISSFIISIIPISFLLGYSTIVDRSLHYLAQPLALTLSMIGYNRKSYKNLIGFIILQFLFLFLWLHLGKHAEKWDYNNIFFPFI
ncbi:EpsG family protein [Halobacteriovorax sp. ZH5_bin.2]|uniref:EpsG family protein n=1 Tax=Halobacteriovorax sp. ZH5_bin.2 TaxID=3157727 RepID=UPI003724B87C